MTNPRAVKNSLRLLSPLHRSYRQATVHLEAAIKDLGVSAREGHLLSFVDAYGPSSIGELRRVFGHKGSTLTSLLDRLEKRDLVRRLPHPEDRRSLLVEATTRGREVGLQVLERVAAFEGDLIADLSDRDLKGFDSVVRAIDHATSVNLRRRKEP